MTNQASVALMKFLSSVATRLGVAEHVYVVGGAVRNFVIQRPIKDIDVVIDSVALKGRDSDWFAKQVARAIPAETSLVTNTYGVAILSIVGDWEIGGTNLKGDVIEIANARKESYTDESEKPEHVEPATIQEDVYRREFTFNTLMWRLLDLASGPDKAEIIDLTGCGMKDLQEGMARCPRDPDVVFSDDPTRMVRAVKFLLKYNLQISPEVRAAIIKNRQRLRKIKPAALSNLLINTFLRDPIGPQAIQELHKLGLLEVIKEIAQESPPLREALAGWADREAQLEMLFVLMDFGLPSGKRLSFLPPAQQQRVRAVTVEMSHGAADAYVAVLAQPGKVLDTATLMAEFNLKGPAVRQLQDIARMLMLDDPALAADPVRLTAAVRREMRGGKVAGEYVEFLQDQIRERKESDRQANMTGVVEVPKNTYPVEVQPPKAKRKKFPFQGFIDFQGLQIDVENKAGSTRSGVSEDGTEWSTKMHHHYGEIRGTEGSDGDKLDCYVGPNHDSSLVVVVHQHDPETGKFDEDKCMLGFDSEEEAIGAYKKQYDRPGFFVEDEYLAMPIGQFWRWVHDDRNKGKKVKASDRVAERYLQRQAKTFELNVGDPVLYGKFLNKPGTISGFGKNEKGDPTVTLESGKGGPGKEVKLFKVRYDEARAGKEAALDLGVWRGRGKRANAQLALDYRTKLEKLTQSVAEGRGLGFDSPNLWVDWFRLYQTGKQWGQYIIDKLAIPAGQAKAVEMAVRLFSKTYGRGKSPTGGIVNWFDKNIRHLRFLTDAATWPERSEDSGIFKHGPFTVHNTVGADEKALVEVREIIDRTLRMISGTGVTGLAQMAYGDLYIVGQLGRKNWAAWYMPDKDAIYLRPKMRGVPAVAAALHLLHEIGHRYWRKVASRDLKVAWNRHHDNMGVGGRLHAPDVGTVLPLKVNNQTVRVEMYLPSGRAMLVNTDTGQEVGFVESLKLSQWVTDAERKLKFPTIYASTDAEEHFCESLAHKGSGDLTPDNEAAFDAIVLRGELPALRTACGCQAEEREGLAGHTPSYERLFLGSLDRVAARYKDKKKVKTEDGDERTVYEYSDRQIANRNREKAERVEKLRNNLSKLHERVKKDLKSDDPKTRLCALAVGLMNDTYERVGNDESAKDGHVGVTGWTPEHIKFSKGKATFTYVGKSGVDQKKETSDADLIRVLKDAVKDKAKGDTLFTYEDGRVDAAAVNEYLDDLDLGITAKDIRGLHANREMQERLKAIRSKGGKLPEEKKDREKQLKDEFKKALEGTAEAVGHEASTLRSQYLVPGLEEEFLKDGTVTEGLNKKGSLRRTAAYDILRHCPLCQGIVSDIHKFWDTCGDCGYDVDISEGRERFPGSDQWTPIPTDDPRLVKHREQQAQQVAAWDWMVSHPIHVAPEQMKTASMQRQAVISIYNAWPEENTYDGPAEHVELYAFDDLTSSLTAYEWALINDMDREAGGQRYIQYHSPEGRRSQAWDAYQRYVAAVAAEGKPPSFQEMLPDLLKRYPTYTWRGYAVDEGVLTELQGAGFLGPEESGKIGLSDEFLGKRQLYRMAHESLDRAVNRLLLRQATKSHAEKEDEEVERLSRPVPTKKPPRDDLKRERVQEDDPDLKPQGAEHDKDLSLNYKKRAVDRVALRYLMGDDRLAKSKNQRQRSNRRQKEKERSTAQGAPASAPAPAAEAPKAPEPAPAPAAPAAPPKPKKPTRKPGDYWQADTGTWMAWPPGAEKPMVAQKGEEQAKLIAKGQGKKKTKDQDRGQVEEMLRDDRIQKKQQEREEGKSEEELQDAGDVAEADVLQRHEFEQAQKEEAAKAQEQEAKAKAKEKARKDIQSRFDRVTEDLPEASQKALAAVLQKKVGPNDPDPLIAAGEAYTQSLRQLNGNSQSHGFSTEDVKAAAHELKKPTKLKGLTPEEMGAALARRQYLLNRVLDPTRLGGQKVSDAPKTPEALAQRGEQAYEQARHLTDDAREHMVQKAADHLETLDPDSNEAAEMNRIIDGMFVAALAKGQVLEVKGKNGKALRDPLPENMAMIAKHMAKNGDIGILVGGVQDFYGPSGREALVRAVKTMDTEDLVAASKDQPWAAMANAANDPLMDEETRGWLKEMSTSMMVDGFTSMQGLAMAGAKAMASDGTTNRELQREAATLYQPEEGSDTEKKMDAFLKCMEKNNGDASKCRDTSSQGGSTPGEAEDPKAEVAKEMRRSLFRDALTRVKKLFHRKGKDLPVTDPAVARITHFVETGDDTVLDAKLEGPKKAA